MAPQIVDDRVAEEQHLTMTYEDFLMGTSEDTHAEWVNGEVTVFMPPKTIHQRIVFWLSTLIALYTRHLNRGEVVVAPFEMRLGPGSAREPDILFVAREHQDRTAHSPRCPGHDGY